MKKEEIVLKKGDKIVCLTCDKEQIKDSHGIREIIEFEEDTNRLVHAILECGHRYPIWLN